MAQLNRDQPAGLPVNWNVTAADLALDFAADRLVPAPAVRWTRAVAVDAPAAMSYRWLCQLRAAPYSYDLIDNVGRRSPTTLTAGLEDVQVGQRLLRIFVIGDVEPGRSLTLLRPAPGQTAPWFAMTYVAVTAGASRSRLVCRLTVAERRGLMGAVGRYALAWGDLVMISHQLHRLAGYAARDAAAALA